MPLYALCFPRQTDLSRATTHLENAHNSKDQKRAKKHCDKAEKLLERIKIKTTSPGLTDSPSDLDQIVAKYREHGTILDKWGFKDEAQLSHSEASELRYELER